MWVVFDSGPVVVLCENMTSSTNQKYIPVTFPSKEDRTTATGNMYGKFDEIWTTVFEICEWTDSRRDRQTDRQTGTLIAICCPLAGQNKFIEVKILQISK